jgi:hypothetical protein
VREDALFVDRPTALDLAFLDLETPQAPLHVGWTLRFGGVADTKGRDDGGTPTADDLEAAFDALCQPARTAARPGGVTPWRAQAQARRQRAANR